MARSKVAPLKMMSIPRLELQAAVIGARLLQTVVEAHSLEIKQRFIWSDSRTVVSWIHSEQRRYKPFVAFRIGEILSLTKHSEWRWISTKNNIADDLTKWKSGSNLDSNGPWFRGPRFLYQPEQRWMKQEVVEPNTPEEVRACHLFHDLSAEEPMVDVSRISRWKVLVRTVACVYRFTSNCDRRRRGLAIEAVPASPKVRSVVKKVIPAVVVPLKREEFQRAEGYLWRSAQADAYEEEVKILTKNRELPRSERQQIEKSSSLYSDSPFLDEEGILRMEGRAEELDAWRGERGVPWS
ncbi:uncharacterized protein LOC134291536 [Aedes albopictus]|uniref:RNase H type-1 domain-containing protein n=1 Tax=Aedes albopictus TaxID=7160 RepID=A0ABM1YJE2_AEDAL